MYDTRLTAGGLAQARKARERVKGLTQCPFPPGVIVVSPLTRALRTMEEAFADVLATGDVPVVVTPLASERVYHGSDVGALRSELEAEFPRTVEPCGSSASVPTCVPMGVWDLESELL